MKRILVIGCSGAGKSTFSRRLQQATGIELIHLDKIYWQPGWREPAKAEWIKVVDSQIAKDAWIMDGNFRGTLEMRLKRCDTVIFFDLPRTVCLWRVLKRIVFGFGKTRPDMGADCPEWLDLGFLRWIWNFPKKDKPKVERLLTKYGENVDVIRFRSSRESEKFLAQAVSGEQ